MGFPDTSDGEGPVYNVYNVLTVARKYVPSVMYNQLPSSAGRTGMSHLKSIAFLSEEEALQKLRERLRCQTKS